MTVGGVGRHWRILPRPLPRRLLELPNALAAERWAQSIADLFAAEVGRPGRALTGRVDMWALLAPADPGQLPAHRLLGS
jgi:hypothetical protein